MAHQKWSREIVIETIRRLYEAGSRLDYSFVHKNERSLLWAAERYIGKWDSAVEAAGIEYNSLRITPKRIVWSPQKVIEEIKKLDDADLPLNSNYAQTQNRRLYGAAMNYYGSWKCAVEAAGFDYSLVKIRDLKPVTVQRVVDEIKTRIALKKSINGGVVSHEDRGLYARAQRFFPGKDSWRRALMAAGVNPEELIDPKIIWTKEVVLQTIKDRFEKGESLYGLYLNQNNLSGLYGAGIRIFGSWGAAIEAAGLSYQNVRANRHNYWTPETVISEIKAYETSGNVLSLKSTQSERADLLAAAILHFGTWGLAVEAAGFSYQEHCKVRSTKFWLSKLDNSDYKVLMAENLTRAVKTRNAGGKKKRKGND